MQKVHQLLYHRFIETIKQTETLRSYRQHTENTTQKLLSRKKYLFSFRNLLIHVNKAEFKFKLAPYFLMQLESLILAKTFY